MAVPIPTVTPQRERNLSNPLLVAAVFLAATAIYLVSMVRSPYVYTDPRFVVSFFSTELQVIAWLLLATALLFPPARIGLRWPQRGSIKQLAPMALLLLIAVVAWAYARANIKPGVAFDSDMSLHILRTTLAVGVAEEWIFRGLLAAALSRWLGLRKGALIALVMFGAFHLLNMVLGVPPLLALTQMGTTILIGSTFALAAIGTRSLLLPMLAHGLYDFAVFDGGRAVAAGAPELSMAGVPLVGLVVGIYCLVSLFRLQGSEPFPD